MSGTIASRSLPNHLPYDPFTIHLHIAWTHWHLHFLYDGSRDHDLERIKVFLRHRILRVS